MMRIAGIILAFTIFRVSEQIWVNRARLSNFEAYFQETMQNMIYEVEKREWCNLQIQENTVVVNEHMYKWHVTGNVTYANGFLVSIQKIDISNIANRITSQTVNNTRQAIGTIQGVINFRDATVGFDVIFRPEDSSEQSYTGVFSYRLMSFRAVITKNFHTGEIITSVDAITLSPDSTRMAFMPANNVTEVLSRQTFIASSILRSVNEWGRGTMQPILQNLVITKMEFPNVCFVNC